MHFTRKEAEEYFADICHLMQQRSREALSFSPEEAEESLRYYISHCQVVAQSAEKLAAQASNMDAEAVYIMGLLHDAGRIEFSRFHGLVGYEMMQELDEPEVAHTCLVHTFVKGTPTQPAETLLPLERGQFYNKFGEMATEDLAKTSELIAQTPLEEVDYLIRLADFISDGRHTEPVKIEVRVENLRSRYGNIFAPESFEQLVEEIRRLKTYWDQRLGVDVYELLCVQ